MGTNLASIGVLTPSQNPSGRKVTLAEERRETDKKKNAVHRGNTVMPAKSKGNAGTPCGKERKPLCVMPVHLYCIVRLGQC